jgi:hypothetical protein
MFIFAENETNCTNNFVQVWNDLVDYCARSGYGEHEKIERPLEESVDASQLIRQVAMYNLQAIEANAPVDSML